MKIQFNKPESRRDVVTFTLNETSEHYKVEWTLKDKWLGGSDDAYCPKIDSNGLLLGALPDLEDYFDRIVTSEEKTFSSSIFFPLGAEIEAKVTIYEDETLTNELDSYVERALVIPEKDEDNIVVTSSMRLHYKALQCAPILSTHAFHAFYTKDCDSIQTQCVTLIEEDNKNVKQIFGHNALEFRHTWQTQGKKRAIYSIFYDDGFRLREACLEVEFKVQDHEIKDKDELSIVSDKCIPHYWDTPPKVHVICTKRCITGVSQDYSFKVNG